MLDELEEPAVLANDSNDASKHLNLADRLESEHARDERLGADARAEQTRKMLDLLDSKAHVDGQDSYVNYIFKHLYSCL